MSNMEPGYSRFRRRDDGQPVKNYWYDQPSQQQSLLVRAVRELRADGFIPEEIVILSFKAANSAAVNCDDPWLAPQLIYGAESLQSKIRFYTVHAFKGLEAPAIILTDVDDPALVGFSDLLYIGLSRATDRLTVLATRSAIGTQVLVEESH